MIAFIAGCVLLRSGWTIRIECLFFPVEMLSKASPERADYLRRKGSDHNRDRLCEICAAIDFDKWLEEEIKRRFLLGRWDRIKREQNCPFCRLVTECLRSDPKLTPPWNKSKVLLANRLSWELGIEISPYDLTKSESYSNKYDLRSVAKGEDKTYRLLVYAEDGNPASKGRIQYLSANDSSKKGKFYGRQIRQDRIDIGLLRAWLSRCRRWHDDQCDIQWFENRRPPNNLRMIDVKQRRIIRWENVSKREYVALSYTWGIQKMKEETGMAPVTLLREHVRANESIPLPARLPQTIEDAIWLTLELGFRYLWVDALCIIQDDPYADKIGHLAVMSVIYSLATLTIAAGAGDHADYGLPGIGVPRKMAQYIEMVNGVQLATMFPSYTALENSSVLFWNTRAWTFQEKLLSRRLLLFTDEQVYFKCSEAIWTEEIALETRKVSNSVEARRRKYAWKPTGIDFQKNILWKSLQEKMSILVPSINLYDRWDYLGTFVSYAAGVREYTSRQLSDHRDVIFAIIGVLETLGATGQILQGLPESHFLDALVWFPEVGTIIRRVQSENPSWTWAGWKFIQSRASYNLMDVRALRTVLPLLREVDTGDVYERTLSNLDTCVEWFEQSAGHPVSEATYYSRSTAQALPIRTVMDNVHINPTVQSRIENVLNSLHEDISYADIPETVKPPPKWLNIEATYLLLKTIVVRFRIGRVIESKLCEDLDGVALFELLDNQGRRVGEVWMTYRIAKSVGRREVDFLSVTRGLGLKAANIDEYLIPRWHETVHSNTERREEIASSYEKFADVGMGGFILQEIHQRGLKKLEDNVGRNNGSDLFSTFSHSILSNIPAQLVQHTGLDHTGQRVQRADGFEDTSAKSLFRHLMMAEKGLPQPRELWTVVNLIPVRWEGDIARRIGVGKVISGAWQAIRSPPRTVVFM